MDEVDTTNEFMVSSTMDGQVSVLMPVRGVSRDQALTLAAWLVLMADPSEERFEEIKEAVAST